MSPGAARAGAPFSGLMPGVQRRVQIFWLLQFYKVRSRTIQAELLPAVPLYDCQGAFGGINSRIRALARCCDLFHDPLDSHILPASIGRADNGGACQPGNHTAIGLPVYAGRPPELILLKSEGYARGSAPSIPGLLQKSQLCRLRI